MIYQRVKGDCCICAIAMAVGATYEDVVSKIGKHDFAKFGVSQDLELEVLRAYGWKPVLTFSFPYQEPCILSVASLNYYGTLHSVYWDGKRMYDPSTERQHDYKSACLGYAGAVMDEGSYSREVVEYERSIGYRV